MKKYPFIIFLILNIKILFAQEPVVTITPEKPHRGESITITYNPSAKKAKIKNAKEMELVYDNYAEYYGKIKKMTRSGNKWEAILSLQDTVTAFVNFYFRSLGEYDDNKEKFYSFQVFNSKGLPVKNSFYDKSRFFHYRLPSYSQDHIKRRDSIELAELLKELELYPENSKAKNRQYVINLENSLAKEASFEEKKKEVEKDRTLSEENKKLIFESLLKSERSKKVQKYFQYMREASSEKKKKMAEELIREFSNEYNISNAYKVLFEYYTERKDTSKIIETGRKWLATEKVLFSNACCRVAEVLLKYKINLDEAMKYIDRAIECIDKDMYYFKYIETDTGYVMIPLAYNRKHFFNLRKDLLVIYNNTKGKLYSQMGYPDKSELVLREAFYIQPWNINSASLLINLYEQAGKTDSIYSVRKKYLEFGYGNKDFEEKFREVYILKNTSDKGFSEVINQIEILNKKIRKQMILSNRYNLEVPEFTIKTDNGKIFDLEETKGKVIFLYFFETLGISFKNEAPLLKKLRDKYKGKKDFYMLAINVAKGKLESAERHKQIIKEYNIDFPTAYDENNRIIKMLTGLHLGIPGPVPESGQNNFFNLLDLPTSFVIDKSGNLRYSVSYKYDIEDTFENIDFAIQYLHDNKE